jgi:hypothetical protein
MWISDRHPNPPKPAAPPTETGRRLATLARGNDAELRVTLSDYQGRPYCAFRVWERGTDGHLWPARNKGLSVRISELADGTANNWSTRRSRIGSNRPAPRHPTSRTRMPASVTVAPQRLRGRTRAASPCTGSGAAAPRPE